MDTYAGAPAYEVPAPPAAHQAQQPLQPEQALQPTPVQGAPAQPGKGTGVIALLVGLAGVAVGCMITKEIENRKRR